ncbi:1-phosphofructokinase [Moraxella sp. ZY210820]|uniref:1-phosphofructokinase n=1 Tax=unclassified Moraxella TaxID=2685852 RepID=UPI00272EF7B7|nr:1-phosphofructokinase [Moraxella sp. ZY210820]WLF84656.1 1-phosphofructokinase [Moraxella sp. ZY210820]
MAKVLCITLNPAIDMSLELEQIQLGAVNRQQHAQSHAAGKGLNVAQVLKDLGHDVYVSGFLGRDNYQIFEQHFAREQFDSHFILVDGETRHNIKLIESAGRVTDINGKGFVVTERQKQSLFEQCLALAPQMDCIVIAGSLPQNFTLEDFKSLVEQLTAVNSRIALDTSGQALAIAMQLNPWLIKPNTDELSETFQQSLDTIEQQMQFLADYHIEHAVISMGEQGVNWLTPERVYQAKPAQVQVKSTVGAGDTLLAGMIHGLMSHVDDVQILSTATALATYSVTQVGFHIPSTAHLQRLIEQTQVQKIDLGVRI